MRSEWHHHTGGAVGRGAAAAQLAGPVPVVPPTGPTHRRGNTVLLKMCQLRAGRKRPHVTRAHASHAYPQPARVQRSASPLQNVSVSTTDTRHLTGGRAGWQTAYGSTVYPPLAGKRPHTNTAVHVTDAELQSAYHRQLGWATRSFPDATEPRIPDVHVRRKQRPKTSDGAVCVHAAAKPQRHTPAAHPSSTAASNRVGRGRRGTRAHQTSPVWPGPATRRPVRHVTDRAFALPPAARTRTSSPAFCPLCSHSRLACAQGSTAACTVSHQVRDSNPRPPHSGRVPLPRWERSAHPHAPGTTVQPPPPRRSHACSSHQSPRRARPSLAGLYAHPAAGSRTLQPLTAPAPTPRTRVIFYSA
jgi:hypothetical protein